MFYRFTADIRVQLLSYKISLRLIPTAGHQIMGQAYVIGLAIRRLIAF